MPLQQTVKLQHRHLVGNRLPAQVDVYEAAYRKRILERILRPRIGQVEQPLLQEVNSQHPLDSNRRPPLPDFA